MTIVYAYGAYSVFGIALTIWVATTLFKNGRVFLVDVFAGNEDLADAVNHLLVVGFYLINLGWIALMLKIEGPIGSARESIEQLSWKLGTVMLILGAMHFLNLIIFTKVRSNQFARKQSEQWIQRQMSTPIPPPPPGAQRV